MDNLFRLRNLGLVNRAVQLINAASPTSTTGSIFNSAGAARINELANSGAASTNSGSIISQLASRTPNFMYYSRWSILRPARRLSAIRVRRIKRRLENCSFFDRYRQRRGYQTFVFFSARKSQEFSTPTAARSAGIQRLMPLGILPRR